MAEEKPGNPPLSRSMKVGDIRIHLLEAGTQRLDGGAMFGVVPKPLWERRIAPDERNRIPLSLRCLLIEAPGALVLVDTGIGGKGDARFQELFGVDNDGDPSRLEDAIRFAGFEPDAVEVVVMTHLHFDHAGGLTRGDADGRIVPSFPSARHLVQRAELRFAAEPNERTRASYRPEDLDPVTRADLWAPVDGETLVTRGVRLVPTPGHTPGHQSVLVESSGETACFLADVCPTSAHLPLPWIMGYDVEPLVTLETKRYLWERALGEDWLLLFEHDPVLPWGRLHPDGRRLVDAEGTGGASGRSG